METIIVISVINIACFSLGFFFCYMTLTTKDNEVKEEEIVYFNNENFEDEEAFVPEKIND